MNNKVLFGASGVTSIHPVILGVLAVAILLILFLPRRHVVAAVLIPSLLVPMGQVLMVSSFHFQVFRILVFAGWMRLLLQRAREGSEVKLKINAIDRCVLAYAVSCVVCYTLLWQETAALISQLGTAYTVLGMYFFFRFFVRDQEDVERTIKVLAVTSAVIGAFMINEQVTGKNVLAMFGGVPEDTFMRSGYFRSQGPFQVYLTAGAFGATQIPLMLTLWRKGGKRLLAIIGVAAAIAITVTSKTSTATSAALAVVVGLALWPFRDYMRVVRWGIACTIVLLQLVMKAPVWALIQRVDLVGGSDSWHRFKIVDEFIKHFFDWWLMGARNYMTWEGGGDMWDLANQYVYTGETTGLLSLIFFVAIIVYCFKYLGRARQVAGSDSRKGWFLWLLGVTLGADLIAFMGISYFDQTVVYWTMFLALVTAASVPEPEEETETLSEETELEEPQGWPALEGTAASASYGRR